MMSRAVDLFQEMIEQAAALTGMTFVNWRELATDEEIEVNYRMGEGSFMCLIAHCMAKAEAVANRSWMLH